MEKYGKKHKNPPGTFCLRVPIMHAIDSFFGKIQISVNHKRNLVCTHFTIPLILEVRTPDYECRNYSSLEV